MAQYLGDGLMIYFGWPRAHEDDAERGVRSALEMVRALKRMSAAEPLAVRIGVATGAVVVGKRSGEDNGQAKLAVGETPNLASRLQGLAGPDEIVIAAATRRLVGDAFELSDLGARPLKGIEEPAQAWRVDAVRRTSGRFEAAHGGVALTPLVGREEVALLLRRWQQARYSARAPGRVRSVCVSVRRAFAWPPHPALSRTLVSARGRGRHRRTAGDDGSRRLLTWDGAPQASVVPPWPDRLRALSSN